MEVWPGTIHNVNFGAYNLKNTSLSLSHAPSPPELARTDFPCDIHAASMNGKALRTSDATLPRTGSALAAPRAALSDVRRPDLPGTADRARCTEQRTNKLSLQRPSYKSDRPQAHMRMCPAPSEMPPVACLHPSQSRSASLYLGTGGKRICRIPSPSSNATTTNRPSAAQPEALGH